MSVKSSQRTVTNLQVKDTAMQLYLKTCKLVYNKDIVPQPLNSEFKYPVTGNLRDMCTNIAIALQCDPVKDFKRREEKLMSAHDCTVINDTYIELLSRSRALPTDLVTDILEDNVAVGRMVKLIMADDRAKADLDFKGKVKTLENGESKNGESLFADPSEKKGIKKVDTKTDLFNVDDTSSCSINELRRRTLEEAPQFSGIITNPTDPMSPVIDKVKDCQKKRGQLVTAATSKIKRNRKSSK